MNKNVLIITVLLAGWFLFPTFYSGMVLAQVDPGSEYSSGDSTGYSAYAENEPNNEPGNDECANEGSGNEDGSECAQDSECKPTCTISAFEGFEAPTDSECESEEAVEGLPNLDCSSEEVAGSESNAGNNGEQQEACVAMSPQATAMAGGGAGADDDKTWAEKVCADDRRWGINMTSIPPPDNSGPGLMQRLKRVFCSAKKKYDTTTTFGKWKMDIIQYSAHPAECRCGKCKAPVAIKGLPLPLSANDGVGVKIGCKLP